MYCFYPLWYHFLVFLKFWDITGLCLWCIWFDCANFHFFDTLPVSGCNYWVLFGWIFYLFFDYLTCCSSSGYDSMLVILVVYSWSNERFNWYGFIIWFYSLFTCWSFSWYPPSTGTIGGTSGEVAFTNISARDLNDSLCEFTIMTSMLAGSGFCSAWIKYYAAWIVASVEDIFWHVKCFGRKIYCVWDFPRF